MANESLKNLILWRLLSYIIDIPINKLVPLIKLPLFWRALSIVQMHSKREEKTIISICALPQPPAYTHCPYTHKYPHLHETGPAAIYLFTSGWKMLLMTIKYWWDTQSLFHHTRVCVTAAQISALTHNVGLLRGCCATLRRCLFSACEGELRAVTLTRRHI